jgi:hypothetical protein
MVFGFLKKRDDTAHKKIEDLNKSVSFSFSNLKRDMDYISNWITHFKDKHDEHNENFDSVHKRLERVEQELEEMRDMWTRVQTGVQTRVQTAVQTGQTRVQTRVGQTDVRLKQMSVQTNTLEKLKNLSVMERGLVWVLVNSDAKMSYEDIYVILGKNKSTLRGQINNIKLKSPDLIKEEVENDGTKKFYVSKELKDEIMGRSKKIEIQAKKRVKRGN